MLEAEVVNPTGLHARPASVFAETAMKYKSAIKVQNLASGKEVNAKSIVRVLTLGANQGTRIRIQAEGEDELEAAAELARLVEGGFGEA